MDIPFDDQERNAMVDLAGDMKLPDIIAPGIHLGADRGIGRGGARPHRHDIDPENPGAYKQDGTGRDQTAPGTAGGSGGQGPAFLFLSLAEGRVNFLLALGLFDRRIRQDRRGRLQAGQIAGILDLGCPDMTARSAAHTTTVRANRIGIGTVTRGT